MSHKNEKEDKQFSITEYVKTATEIVANMIESL